MILFLFIILVLLYFCIPKKESRRATRLFVYSATVIMAFLSGFRNIAVGNDTDAYLSRFHESHLISWNDVFAQFWLQYFSPDVTTGKDPGYSVFVKFISSFTDNEQLFLLIIALVLLIPFATFILRHSARIEDALFGYIFYAVSYFSYLPNSAARQSIALALIIIAYLFLEDNRSILFLFFILIASTFHQSAIGALIMYPLFKIRNVRTVFYLSLAAFVVMLFYYNQVGAVLASSNDIYNDYEAGGYYSRGNARPFMVFFVFLIIYAVGFIPLIKKATIKGKDKLLFVGTGVSLAIIPLIWYDPSCIRLNSYFGVYVCPFIPYCLRYCEISGKRVLTVMLYAMLLLKTIRTPMEYKFYWQTVSISIQHQNSSQLESKGSLLNTYHIS